jgi:hypothetical protein
MKKNISIFVYGTEQICATCMNLPSSKDTYEWLEAAVLRKFPHQSFTFEYIDIFSPPNDELKKNGGACNRRRFILSGCFYRKSNCGRRKSTFKNDFSGYREVYCIKRGC